ncbi:MAG TPA: STAS domain-containing protein [Ktedonobacteraceae bacterium]
MATSTFEARVRHQPAVAIIDLQGEINVLAEEILNTAYEEAAKQQPEVILLNFRDIAYINSTGIALVVGLLKRSRQAKRTLAACNMSDHYREIFHITRLTDYMRLFPDEASALAETKGQP